MKDAVGRDVARIDAAVLEGIELILASSYGENDDRSEGWVVTAEQVASGEVVMSIQDCAPWSAGRPRYGQRRHYRLAYDIQEIR